MSSTVPTWEPRLLTAGDRWLWERQDLADYPAGTWVLSYSLAKADRLITLTATASGINHLIDVAAATTAAYPAGTYRWQAHVTSGSDRRTIGQGQIVVGANFATEPSGIDDRTHARRVFESIEAVIEGRASKDQEAYTIAGRSLQRTPIADLLKLRDRYKAMVESENVADRLNSGLGGARRLLVRM